jgi:hypothetical protein
MRGAVRRKYLLLANPLMSRLSSVASRPVDYVFQAHPAQAEVLAGSRRFNVLACGRRWGKTILGVDRAIECAMAGFPVGWFAPAYKYLKEPWRLLNEQLRALIVRSNETEKVIELVTGGRVDFWSLRDNDDAGRSAKYARIIVDEAAMVRRLGSWWAEAGRPTLADYQGDAWFLSTPKGRNFFWSLFCDQGEAFARWQMPTATNPYIAAEEIEAARASTPERAFRQEWLAEFIDESGGVFQGVFECVEPGMGEAHPVDGQRYYMGVDLARYEDWTVLCVLDASGRQVYLERFNQISWERQIAAIERVARRYAATVLVDSTGVGDPIYERLRALGLPVQPFHFTASSKDQLIDNLAILLEQQRLKLMDNEVQTNELISYEYEQLASGRLRANAPQGMHDDCVIALALAAWAMSARRALSVL